MTPIGFPHSETCGSTLFWQLTALFRGLSVLLRRHVPRHPPRALSRLSSLLSSKVRSTQSLNYFSSLSVVTLKIDHPCYSSPIRRSLRNCTSQCASRAVYPDLLIYCSQSSNPCGFELLTFEEKISELNPLHSVFNSTHLHVMQSCNCITF